MLPPPPPARVAALPHGTRLAAALGHSTVIADLDFETYSEAGAIFDPSTKRWRGPPGAAKGKRGLPVIGAAVYAEHPSTEVIWCAYDLKSGRGPQQWRPGLSAPLDLFEYLAQGGLLEAWNVGFEFWVWTKVCVPRYGWPAVPESQWRCAMAKARAHALPGKLEDAATVLALDINKDPEGVKLINLLSIPRNPTAGDSRLRVAPVYTTAEIEAATTAIEAPVAGLPRTASNRVTRAVEALHKQLLDEHALTLRFGQYNLRDIEVEAEVSALVPDLEGDELAWWQAHERINRRGVQVDLAAVDDCLAIVEQVLTAYNAELFDLTGIDAASKVEQLQGWLHGRGVHLDSLDEEAVEQALEATDLPPEVRRVLEIRAAAGSASVKKLYGMRNRSSTAGRLHDLYIFFGARTGRSTGADVQPTNMPKFGPPTYRCLCGRHYGEHRLECPWCGLPHSPTAKTVEWNPAAADDALEVIKRRSMALLEQVFGPALKTISGCLRAMFIAAPGHDLIGDDFDSIEAVGLAMVSGEQWRIEVFRGDGKIYEKSAAMMYGVPYKEFADHKARTGQHHPLRQKGKIGELAFGYQGWTGAAAAFGMPGTEYEVIADILKWRAASPAIEWLWGGQTLGRAAKIVRNALTPGYAGSVSDVHAFAASADRWDDTPHYFGVEGAAVQALLTNGTWFDIRRLNGTFAGISFMAQRGVLYCRLPSGRVLHYHRARLEQSECKGWEMSYEGNNTNPKNGPVGWIRMRTWGGRLVENIIQAVCRDVLRHAVLTLEAAGYPVVLHVYDEIVAEVPKEWGSIEEFERLATTPAEWYADWPVRAPGGYREPRYGKR